MFGRGPSADIIPIAPFSLSLNWDFGMERQNEAGEAIEVKLPEISEID